MSKTVLRAPLLALCGLLLSGVLADGADQPIRLARDPALSPDGKRLAFSWNGDIWLAGANGGVARRLTDSSARDTRPVFSPDGKQLALISDRSGASQVHVVNVGGGVPQQLTFHSDGCSLEQWNNESMLIRASRDHFWRKSERFFQIKPSPRSREEIVFDAYGSEGRMSRDGKKILFVREGVRGYRKGYKGSQAGQVWMYDLETKKFTMLANPEQGARYPFWHPNGKEFFYVGAQGGAFDIYRRDLKSGKEKQLTKFVDDDSVLMPTISRNGKVIVFRRGFEFYRISVDKPQRPTRIRLVHRGDEIQRSETHNVLSSASAAAFSRDGLEVAFVAGGDLWVMDTVLKEPKQITDTPELESSPTFSPKGDEIWYVSDTGGKSDIWKASRKNSDEYWWQNDEFALTQVTNDSEQETELTWSPTGKQLAFLKGRGDLWLMDADGKNAKCLLKSWNSPDFDWSPDGKWMVYAVSDNDFNRDIFIHPIDGSRAPFNLSRHPDNDFGPVWSPDGKMIAFTGRRVGSETDIYYVQLQKSESEISSRDKLIKQALEKIKKTRKTPSKPSAKPAAAKPPAAKADPAKPDPAKAPAKPAAKPTGKPAAGKIEPKGNDDSKTDSKAPAEKPAEKKLPEVKIDFDDLALRVKRISISDASEGGLFWSHDSKKLAFAASINGKRGLYTISPPSSNTPKLLSTTVGANPRWISQGNQIVWLVSGKPSSLSSTGQSTSYAFSAKQKLNLAARNKVVFDLCWREMRDNWYDEKLNNRNWAQVRRKYAPMAAEAVDNATLSAVVNMMLGELNGSHLGFFMRGSAGSTGGPKWRDTTAHFGVRYDDAFMGPGLKIKDVIRNSPATREGSRLRSGEVILSIDGTDVDPAIEMTSVLNGDLKRDIVLQVKNEKGETRKVMIRPISFGSARSLLYEQWIYDSQQDVEKASKGKFAYVHIQGMNMTSFYRFERELFAEASGKDGLIIDVRENGGGSTTDHLLTILTQPSHAITVPRGGGRGYPHDRRVYATWSKPIVVLCNQNSFSNAEIFSHSVKTLGRGKVVGVPTAGGVISTGGTMISDVGFLRMPFRGWFLLDGKDMELNGCVPHHIVWPQPGDMPKNKDAQLSKAMEVLSKDVKAWAGRPKVKLIRASELR